MLRARGPAIASSCHGVPLQSFNSFGGGFKNLAGKRSFRRSSLAGIGCYPPQQCRQVPAQRLFKRLNACRCVDGLFNLNHRSQSTPPVYDLARFAVHSAHMIYSEAAYFTGQHVAHCAAWEEWLRLERVHQRIRLRNRELKGRSLMCSGLTYAGL